MNARDGTTAFLPVDSKIGGLISCTKPKVGQANYVYKKVETGKMINTDTIQQEIEKEKQLNRMDDTNRETNPY